MATTEDLRMALAEVDRQAAEIGEGAEDETAGEDGRAAERAMAAAADQEAALDAALRPLVAEAMDATIGRFQVAQQNPRALPEFFDLARSELSRLLRRGGGVIADVGRARRIEAARRRRNGGFPSAGGGPESAGEGDSPRLRPDDADNDDLGDDTLAAQLATTVQEREALRSERDRLQTAENFLRTVGSEMVIDLTTRTQQVQALQGVVRRRDTLLGDQRKAFLRELCHLRTIIKQWETKGYATTHDASFFNWGDDGLAEQLEAESAHEATEAIAEERARFEKELDAERQRALKTEEGLRRQVAVLEQQARQAALAAPPPVADKDTNTDPMPEAAETAEADVQTNDVFVADTAPDPGIRGGVDLTADDADVVDADDAGCVACPVCASHFKLGLALHASPTKSRPTSKSASRRRSSARPPSGGSVRSSDAQSPSLAVISHGGGGGASEADVVALRAELEEQQRQHRLLMARLQGKEDTLSTAAKTKMETDEARRRVEGQTIRKLHDEVRAKDALLEKKSRELSQLQEEAKRWFAQYQESLPADHAPVNYAALRRMSDAVSSAEAAEEQYRTASWDLLALDLRARGILRGLHDDCRDAEASGDTAQLRICQRAYDSVGHQTRQRCTRARQRRVRLREEANRIWDVVLYYARSVHHAQDPLPPPPRYYSVVGDHGTVGPSPLPPSPMGRRSEIESIMLKHSAAAERANAGRHQVLKLGPVVVDPPPAMRQALSPRDRPSTAPSIRAEMGGAEEGDSPFVQRMRVQVTGVAAAGTGAGAPRPPSAAKSSTRSDAQRGDGDGPSRTGSAMRPRTAGPDRGSAKASFNPAELAGQPLAARRAALVRLMRQDQDTLAVSKQRHIDGTYRTRATRAQAGSFRSSTPSGSTKYASDAELFATPGLTQQRLVGRNESAVAM